MKLIKIIKLVTLVLFLIIMVFLTIVGYYSNELTGLGNGSIDTFAIIIKMTAVFPSLFLACCIILSYFYVKNNLKLIFLVMAFSLWVLSGRMICIWPDGRLSAGWYCIETERFYLCEKQSDCETVMAQQTKLQKLFFWRVRVKNTTTDQIIFVGPMLWNNAIKVLHETFKAGKI